VNGYQRILEIPMLGVSTRNYGKVLPEVAEAVGVAKSSVGRESIEAGAQELKDLGGRRFDDLDLLILYLDSLVFGAHQLLSANPSKFRAASENLW